MVIDELNAIGRMLVTADLGGMSGAEAKAAVMQPLQSQSISLNMRNI
jgi:urocanate hydratase